MVKQVRVLIGGDIGPSLKNEKLFVAGDSNSLFGEEIISMFLEADISIVNLEKPFTDVVTPLGKCPPDYRASIASINGITCLKPSAVSLANNHIMDQRQQGLDSTVAILKDNNIKTVGAGNNLFEAREPLIYDQNGIRLGIYSCAEHEFSIATDSTSGSNPFDPMISLDDIEALKQKCDFVIVLHHGGIQHYPYPTPQLQRICRRMCEKGADIVICQHSHCIGCEEKHNDSTILYGQGNFLLADHELECWKYGLLISIDIKSPNDYKCSYIPIQTFENGVRISKDFQKNSILSDLKKRSDDIKNSLFLKRRFSEFCKQNESNYLMVSAGIPSLLRRIIRRMRIQNIICKWYNRKSRLMLLDYIMCESHREVMEALLND